MGLEDRPEDAGHGENDAYEGNIWQRDPLLPLPEQRPAVATTGAALRFAGVVEDLLLCFRCVDLASEGRCAAHAYPAEVVANGWTFGRLIPVLQGQTEDLT